MPEFTEFSVVVSRIICEGENPLHYYAFILCTLSKNAWSEKRSNTVPFLLPFIYVWYLSDPHLMAVRIETSRQQCNNTIAGGWTRFRMAHLWQTVLSIVIVGEVSM
jgi:hypothetical protein